MSQIPTAKNTWNYRMRAISKNELIGADDDVDVADDDDDVDMEDEYLYKCVICGQDGGGGGSSWYTLKLPAATSSLHYPHLNQDRSTVHVCALCEDMPNVVEDSNGRCISIIMPTLTEVKVSLDFGGNDQEYR